MRNPPNAARQDMPVLDNAGDQCGVLPECGLAANDQNRFPGMRQSAGRAHRPRRAAATKTGLIAPQLNKQRIGARLFSSLSSLLL